MSERRVYILLYFRSWCVVWCLFLCVCCVRFLGCCSAPFFFGVGISPLPQGGTQTQDPLVNTSTYILCEFVRPPPEASQIEETRERRGSSPHQGERPRTRAEARRKSFFFSQKRVLCSLSVLPSIRGEYVYFNYALTHSTTLLLYTRTLCLFFSKILYFLSYMYY